ncbi:guanitoxin biosynthesis heme-dependent pre-guanitoxin N-hydroxylase GntA [Lysobacter humi (ex Lee et al. 2017)]
MDLSPLTYESTADTGLGFVADSLSTRFLAHVEHAAFPCVGAKAALARGAIRSLELASLDCPHSAVRLLDELHDFGAFIDAQDPSDTTVYSLVALFQAPRHLDELQFERRLWALLQRLHDADHARGTPWAEDVGRDPDDARFSLSLGGHPFFVIGLHPGASRMARRFEAPALVFNSHRQFDRLRADGRYAKMQAATRQRDLALQGSLNPNLADFGTAPETRQYSGRAVEADWRCPFHARSGKPH